MNNTYRRTCPSIYRGIVEDNNDPKSLGRCKIRVPSVHGQLTYPIDILPWARPIALSPINSKRGSVNLPDVGDIVWVLFEGENKDFPVYFGGTYSSEDIKVNKDTVDFYIDEDTRISYDRISKKYVVQLKRNKIELSEEMLEIAGKVDIKGELTINGARVLTLSSEGDES